MFKTKTKWKNLKDLYPEMNSEVIVCYSVRDENGLYECVSKVMHEKFITEIESPAVYWIEKPEIKDK